MSARMQGRLTFSLSSLLLVVACVAVGSSLAAAAPALGIIYGTLAVPAMLRTALLLRRELGPLAIPSVKVKVSTFFESIVLLAYIALVCSVLSFVCAGVGLLLGATICGVFVRDEFTQWEVGAWTGLGCGSLTGLAAFVLYMRAYWSRRQF